MKTDKFGQQIYNEQDLFDLLMSEGQLPLAHTFFTDDNIDLKPIRWLADNIPNIEPYTEPQCSVEEFDHTNQQQWLMPTEYRDLDIVKHVLDLCSSDAELQRVGEELLLFADRDMLDLLRYLKFLVDTMRTNNVLWGVGRGSSVASFVLYLLGVHRVNSLYYDLDIHEFLR